MSDDNFIARIIKRCYERNDDPRYCLLAVCLVLRGGREEKVFEEYFSWVRDHGEPDYMILEYWAMSLGMEADVAEAAYYSRGYSRDGVADGAKEGEVKASQKEGIALDRGEGYTGSTGRDESAAGQQGEDSDNV